MSISSLVLELWKLFSFIQDWPEIWKLEIPLSEVWPLSGDWGKLGIRNLSRVFLIKCYWMLQNAIVTVFTVSELLRENHQGGRGRGGGGVITPSSRTQIRVKRQPDKLVKHTQTICRLLVSFLLTYNRFYLLLWWFHCWLWIIKYLLGMWSCAFSFY